MSRKIEIELTSTRDDGMWTWRAAGAKQPKGVLDGALLTGGASVGDVLRAEVESTLDGTEVLSVTPPKTKSEPPAGLIEIHARELADDQLVTTTLAPKRGGDRRDRRDRGDREGRGRGDRDRGPRRDGRGDRDSRDGRGPRRDGPGGRGEGRGDRPRGDRPDRPRRERPAPPPKPKAKRLRAGRTHRKAALAALAPEEQVIAEQILQGGLPAVRQAVDKMNAQAKAEGRPEVKADPLMTIAERLLPTLRAAEWRDKAEAAVADLDELDLRDLRSVVVGADTGARDDESRALAAQVREGLARRVDQEQAAWLAEIAETLDEGRVVRALRLSSRPPKAGAPLPADLAARLAEAASNALTADTLPDRWDTVLDALSFSPVRLTVAPASKPDEPGAELVAAVTKVAGRVPKVAEAFGIEAPADSGRRRPPRPGGPRGGAKRGPRPGGGKPPAAPKAAAAPSVSDSEPSAAPPAAGPGPAGDSASIEPAPDASIEPAPDTAIEVAPATDLEPAPAAEVEPVAAPVAATEAQDVDDAPAESADPTPEAPAPAAEAGESGTAPSTD